MDRYARARASSRFLTIAAAVVALAGWSASCGHDTRQAGGDGGPPPNGCRNSLDCPASQICDLSIAMCVECVTAADCPAMNDCAARTCVPYVTCKNSLDCPKTEVCDAARGRCVACLSDSDCADTSKICVANACRTKCASDRTCTPLGLLCDTTTSSCVRCLMSADCGSGQYCQGGACFPAVCTPGQTTCMLNAVATCNAVGDGYTGNAAPCDPKTCVTSASGATCVDVTVDGGAGTGGNTGTGGDTGTGGNTGTGGDTGTGGGAGGASGAGGAGGAGVGGMSGTGVGGTSGTGRGGTSGTGGTGVGGTSGTGGCGLTIDDMEADTGLICHGDGRMGRWFNYNDGLAGTVQTPPTGTYPLLPERIVPARGTSQFAMHTSGTFTTQLAIGCSLNGLEMPPDTTPNHPYDASKYTGISFYAKGTTSLMLQALIQTSDTESTTYGGTCTASCASNQAYVTLNPTNWTFYQLPFSMFTGGTANGASAPFVAKHAWSVEFIVYNSTTTASKLSADFWIDDLSFY